MTLHRLLCCTALLPAIAIADASPRLEEVEVTGRRVNLVGQATTASQGLVSQQEIELRPLMRTGDVLELVPGMVVTQHSGNGKANQYFLRGFNLDHGTDFATFVDGMPVNMRSHGHGQGYTDLNFLIPETIDTLAYRKGPYHADVGDFSSAGSALLSTADRFEPGMLEAGIGGNDYYRALAMGSAGLGQGTGSWAVEMQRYDGPWRDIEEDVEKVNVMLKYGQRLGGGDASVTLMAYDNQWNSADQIPARAVESGLINKLGSIDDTVGGESSRYSLSAAWRDEQWDITAYAISYDLKLWSNFTYFLEDEEDGDQFEQRDDRWLYGGKTEYRHALEVAGVPMVNRYGGDFRYDDIDEVGLYHTAGRARLGPVRSDSVEQWNLGLFAESTLGLTDRLRTVLGVRYDYFDFEVDSRIDRNINDVELGANSGSENEDKFSLQGSLIYQLDEAWEVYYSIGQGLHSNDARGTTITVDPEDGSEVDAVDPLVGSQGYEVGLRGFWNDRLNTSLVLWTLELDSELLFEGDAGSTEASRASRRRGVELSAYYRLTDEWMLDLEYAWTDSKFTDYSPEGDEIPGAIEDVLQAGISLDMANGWFGSLRVRYFGEAPLTEDGSVTSDGTTVVNLRAGYRTPRWTVKLDVLNLLDSDDHDIDYFYASRLPGEPEGGVEDIHFHILEPRTLRLHAAYHF